MPNLSEGCVKGKICPSWFKAGAFSLFTTSLDKTSIINPSSGCQPLSYYGHPPVTGTGPLQGVKEGGA